MELEDIELSCNGSAGATGSSLLLFALKDPSVLAETISPELGCTDCLREGGGEKALVSTA